MSDRSNAEAAIWIDQIQAGVEATMAEAGYSPKDNPKGLTFTKRVQDCEVRISVVFELWIFGLLVVPKFSIYGVPLVNMASPGLRRTRQVGGMISHWLPPRKRKSKGGLSKVQPRWLIENGGQVPYCVEEISAAIELARPFMESFRSVDDIFSGFERGAFVSLTPKEQEWLKLVWAKEIDPVKETMREYAQGEQGLSYATGQLWQLANGMDIGQHHSAVEVEEYVKFFNGMDPFGWKASIEA